MNDKKIYLYNDIPEGILCSKSHEWILDEGETFKVYVNELKVKDNQNIKCINELFCLIKSDLQEEISRLATVGLDYQSQIEAQKGLIKICGV